MNKLKQSLQLWAFLALSGSAASAQVPPELQNLHIGTDKRTLTWDFEAGATTHNLYRGYLSRLSSSFLGTTLEAGIVGTTFVDLVNPVEGQGFFYIVTGANALGEGTWPHVAIHATVLHNGQLMTWQGQFGSATYERWDPVTETFVGSQTINSDTFCGGHSFLADGRLYVTGGTITGIQGLSTTWLYDVDTDSGPRARRWTPAATTPPTLPREPARSSSSAGATRTRNS